MSQRPPAWLLGLALVGVVAYALGSHWLMVHAADQPWAVAALFGPLLLAVTAGGLKRRHAPTLVLCALVVVVLVVVVWRGGVEDANRMYVLQHAGIHAALAWGFAFTLRPGSTALITALAQRLHRVFTPDMRRYTRQLTKAWAVYFATMVLLSLLIYAFAPWPWWSAFGNLFTPLSAAVFFVGEHILRYWWHPEFERVSLQGVVHAYRHMDTVAEAPADRR